MHEPDERRVDTRASLSLPTEVLTHGRRRGFAWLTDLSRSGARLRCAARLASGAQVRLVLHPPGRPPLALRAIVKDVGMNEDARSVTAHVEFVEPPVEALDVLFVVMGEARSTDAAPSDHAILIISNDTEPRHELAEAVAALGRRPVVVSNPLDAIVWLQDRKTTVDAVFASDRRFDLMEFFGYLEETSPAIRRIVIVEQPRHRRTRVSPMTRLVDAVVTLPAEQAVLAGALRSAR